MLSFTIIFTVPLSRLISSKWLILICEGACSAATLLLSFADRPARYWPLIFPAFVLGSAGAMLTYTHTNIAIFRASPVAMAGTVGAIFNGALQLGSAIGISAVGSIESGVDAASAVRASSGSPWTTIAGGARARCSPPVDAFVSSMTPSVRAITYDATSCADGARGGR